MQSNKTLMTSNEMRALEINAEYFGFDLLQLMELAGRNVTQEIINRFSSEKKVAIFCGLGGNGGDGFVAARNLLGAGFNVTILLVGRDRDIKHKDALKNWNILQSLTDYFSIVQITDSSALPEITADIIVDAMLGTGTKGKLKPPISNIVDFINELKGFKISIDIPTGIDSDTGDILGNAVKADLTVTFHKAKLGLERAKKYAGEIVVADIGLPSVMERFTGPGDVMLTNVQRRADAHKGDFGRLLVVGGSEVFSGAPALVSLAALRTGVDLVYLAAPQKVAQTISSMSPDLITIKLDCKNLKPSNVEEIKPYLSMVDAIVVGPGAGLKSETMDFVKDFIEEVEKAGKPLVLDADAIKAFAKIKRPLKVPVILTPHIGEYAILTGEKVPEELDERVSAIQKTAKQLNAVLLVKSKIDVICDSEHVKLNFSGNSGMTVGGTGDVLSGIVGGVLAMKTGAFQAAVAGAFVNGAAGDFVVNERGYHITASDLIDWIPKILDDPMSHLKVKNASGK
ncbi:MAG: NAD(P)H-hydrate dehydratase [Candidatus Bathyarchaeia archaeon]